MGPVTEHALLSIRAGQEAAFEAAAIEALPVIRAQPGCRGARVTRFVERPTAYLLLVEWTGLAAHEAFRASGADFTRWRSLLHPFYEPFPTVEHVVDIDGS